MSGLFLEINPAASYFPTPERCSIIGSSRLNFRVRDGNGCDPTDRITGKLLNINLDIWQLNTCIISTSCLNKFASQQILWSSLGTISTGQLSTLLHLHLQPINLVVFQGPSLPLRVGRSHLRACFPLICIQRLSQPNFATQPCHWHDNWNTRGSSIPVLSY